ncbi:MAG TPA: acyl carrier protein [Thermoanaerobaculia bacterium]|nr:acyl carrier protein [Thermoanaerobaculia bacterium]
MTSIPERDELERQVIDIVADALSQPRENVQPYSSLMDDLGAESIDFIDIVFRLESAFDMIIPDEQLWAGSLDLPNADAAAIQRGVVLLREQAPLFRWDRFPNGVEKRDLPRLITVTTIVDYLSKQKEAAH